MSTGEAAAPGGAGRTVDVAAVRRWVRRRQAAHLDRGSTLGSVYFALLLGATVTGILWPTVRAVLWPVTQTASVLDAAAAALIVLGGLQLAARRLGPLALSRPAVSWLLTAPVNRRSLLLPSLAAGTAATAGVGALTGVAVVGHLVARPVSAGQLALAAGFGALVGAGTLLAAYAGQAGRRWADDLAYPVIALGLAGLLAGAVLPADSVLPAGWVLTTRQIDGDLLLAPPVLAAAALLMVLVGGGLARTVRRLPATPNSRVLDASRTAGTLFDAVYSGEPSFATEMLDRRYWSSRRLRSRSLHTRLPVLTAQDLRLATRKPRRLGWLAAATTLPLLADLGPGWLLSSIVPLGAMAAAMTAAATVRTDSGNPVLLRLLALSSRRVVAQRLVVPGVLAGAWSAVALGLLSLLGTAPSGPWWALGLALAPVGALAAVSRARLGFVQHGLLPLDTPMGTVATGPVLSAVGGFDMLLLALPAWTMLFRDSPLSWPGVLLQVAVAVAGLIAYLAMASSRERTDLAGR